MKLARTTFHFITICGIVSVFTAKLQNKGCDSFYCKLNDGQLNFDERHSQAEVNEIMKMEKKGCSSPMCWFRVGKRNMKEPSKIFQLSSNNKKQPRRTTNPAVDVKCNSPMCWFRGKKQENLQRHGTIRMKNQFKRILNQMKRCFAQDLYKRLNKRGCSSPMCWFRIGRQIISNKRRLYEKGFPLKQDFKHWISRRDVFDLKDDANDDDDFNNQENEDQQNTDIEKHSSAICDSLLKTMKI